jgi:hypothetical protein
MIIGVIIQQPSDKLDYDIDTRPLTTGTADTLDTVVAVATPSSLVALGTKLDDNTAKLWLQGGVAGTEYKVEVTCTTAEGRIRQDEFVVKIEEF